MQRILLYKRFERFWHWMQALLIIALAFTGFVLHGSIDAIPYGLAHKLHTTLLWALLGLWAFAIFWHFTTGEWKHYVPTTTKLKEVILYYTIGIFKGEDHPYDRTPERKLNPLQRIAYLKLKLILNPGIIISGLLYLFYNEWPEAIANIFSLEFVAIVHTAFAFLMCAFVVIHVYMTTVGHTVTGHIKAMITGYEDVNEHTPAE